MATTVIERGDAMVVLVLVGALFVILGVPLAMGRVRRNWLYGVRTPTSMSSDESWQVINRDGGRALVGWGVVFLIGAVAVAVFDIGSRSPQLGTGIVVASVFVATTHLLVTAIRSGRRVRRGPD